LKTYCCKKIAGIAYTGATAAAVSFILLIFATASPWTLYSWLPVNNTGFTNINSWFGVGPFVAGSQTASYYYNGFYVVSGTVWWNQLNSQNVCGNPNLEPWWSGNNLCTAANGTFLAPPQSIGIQACMVLATILSFISCCSGFSVSRSGAGGGGTAACSSFLAMIFTVAAFAIWTTWPMSTKLQTPPGDYIPIWTSVNSKSQIGLTSGPVVIAYGWTYISTIVSFVLLLFSTCAFSSVSKRLSEEDGGGFGTGAASKMV